MKRIQDDVWETTVEKPFPGLTTHAYLLIRDGGNVLFYNTSHRDDIDIFAALGGVAFQLLSHRDELGDSIAVIRQRYGARLAGHIREQDEFSRIQPPDILFDKREVILGNIEVIPSPGHSPGSTCFLASPANGKRYLFTGDTIYRGEDGSWQAGFIPGYSKAEDRETLADSLRLLQTLQPHLVFSSAFGGSEGFQEMFPADWRGHVERALEGLLG